MINEQSKPTLAGELRDYITNFYATIPCVIFEELEDILQRHEAQSNLQQPADQTQALDMGHGKPVAQVPEGILAKVFIHQFEDGDYEIHDSSSFPDSPPSDIDDKPCVGCVQAVIIRRDWQNIAQPPSPIAEQAAASQVDESAEFEKWWDKYSEHSETVLPRIIAWHAWQARASIARGGKS